MKAVLLLSLLAVAYSIPPYGSHHNRYDDEREVRGYYHGAQVYGPRATYGAPQSRYGPAPGAARGGSDSDHHKGKTYGRQMEYTIRGPHDRGHTKVTETHVSMDRKMSGQEAEQAMKQIMGSMKDSKSDFRDFVKDIGFHDFAHI